MEVQSVSSVIDKTKGKTKMAKSSDPKPMLKVSRARLQTSVPLPGGAGEEITLSQERTKGIELYWVNTEDLGQGILMVHRGESAIVPAVNVKVAFLDNKEIKKQ